MSQYFNKRERDFEILVQPGSLPPQVYICSFSNHNSMKDKVSMNSWAGDLVEWLWEETHALKAVGLNPSAVYWMDIFSH